jgi:hypothetical protein
MASARVTGSEMIHREAAPRSRGSRPSHAEMPTVASMVMIVAARHRARGPSRRLAPAGRRDGGHAVQFHSTSIQFPQILRLVIPFNFASVSILM